jgi:hypothetical protein
MAHAEQRTITTGAQQSDAPAGNIEVAKDDELFSVKIAESATAEPIVISVTRAETQELADALGARLSHGAAAKLLATGDSDYLAASRSPSGA